MQILSSCLRMLRRYGQKLGPYLILEVFLPGGSLLALSLFLYQRRARSLGKADSPMAVAARALVRLVEQCTLALQPVGLQVSREPARIRRAR